LRAGCFHDFWQLVVDSDHGLVTLFFLGLFLDEIRETGDFEKRVRWQVRVYDVEKHCLNETAFRDGVMVVEIANSNVGLEN
jgi:hypothetical protein